MKSIGLVRVAGRGREEAVCGVHEPATAKRFEIYAEKYVRPVLAYSARGSVASVGGEYEGNTGVAFERENSAELATAWRRIADRLKGELGEDLFSSWFARMDVEGRDPGQLHVSVPTRFLKNWVQSHYLDKLVKLAAAEFSDVQEVVIKVRSRGAAKPARREGAVDVVRPEPVREAPRVAETPMASRARPPAKDPTDRGTPLDPALTFESFIMGRSNALAHAAAMRVADAAADAPVSFNPLYIHSLSGLGKTHLLNAIAWRIRTEQPSRRVQFLSAERFMYHFISALRARDVIPFKDFFQSIDVLLIDDFQFLQGKSMLQEFLHTFNSLVDAKRQVIVAADVPPTQLDSIDARMRSRLAGGLVVDIQPPELGLKKQMLAMRLLHAVKRDPSVAVPEDVVEFIANRVNGGGRELEGALIRVIAHQQVVQETMSVGLAASALRDLVQPVDLQRIKIDDIMRIVGRHYNVAKSDLLSPRRARSIVRPRQVGMYLAKRLTSRSLPEIGRRFGGRDHSTVLHAVRKVEELLQKDEQLQREVVLLTKLLEQP
ncbi:chromosomal replication initiator protein [Rhodoligotrophos appendicifer]|uniref:chromosomal replication initiator protein DnaA n=1 Tax=Rhodoligotrophos appendicifer TaxID=987056 RepID=UPI00117D7BE3|nr:chromosomal replication initiator protein DnaA [Rhodoligotrophos appendicifer]